MKPTRAASLVPVVLCGAILLASPSSAQTMGDRGQINSLAASHKTATDPAVNRRHKEPDRQYAFDTYPYGSVCLTYPTYPLPAEPTIFYSDNGCSSKNLYRANIRTSRLIYPGTLGGAYDLYYYDWTDPLDHLSPPFVPVVWTVKALSTPVGEAEPVQAALATSVTSQMGRLCATPAKTCELEHAALAGARCSCRVPGGRVRGSVAP